jgi:hypothetical protein
VLVGGAGGGEPFDVDALLDKVPAARDRIHCPPARNDGHFRDVIG